MGRAPAPGSGLTPESVIGRRRENALLACTKKPAGPALTVSGGQ